MSKFKDWCNQNPGYLTFWTLISGVIAILITIIIASQITFDPSSILTLLNQKIPIPIYVILLFVLALLVFFRKKRREAKSPNPKEINIISDYDTLFIESFTYPSLPKRTLSQICNLSTWQAHSSKYPELRKSFWISHTQTISEEEAINGGIYIFERKFELNIASFKLEKAVLRFLVDDFCVLYVNGQLIKNSHGLEKSEGYSNLHSFDLRNHLNKGSNVLKFEIENRNFKDLMKTDTPFFKSRNKGGLNPYGIIYSLNIVYK